MDHISNAFLPSNTTSQSGKRRSSKRTLTSSEEQQVARLKTWMIASYPNQTVTEEVSTCWTSDWTDVVLRYGADTLVKALTQHRKDSNFLPSQHDLQEQVKVVRGTLAGERAREEQRARRAEEEEWKRIWQEENAAGKQLYGSCAACEGTGIHMTHADGRRYIISPRKGSCPDCKGKGLLRIGEPGCTVTEPIKKPVNEVPF